MTLASARDEPYFSIARRGRVVETNGSPHFFRGHTSIVPGVAPAVRPRAQDVPRGDELVSNLALYLFQLDALAERTHAAVDAVS